MPNPPLPLLPVRARASHKGDYGRGLLVGGSRGLSGAIALAGMAALRGGAGLVTLAVPASIQNVVAAVEPSYMTIALPEDPQGRLRYGAWPALQPALAAATCAAVGPGLGRSRGLTLLVERLFAEFPQPLVLDADALNALAPLGDHTPAPAGPRVLTPHPGEFRRLAGDEALPPQRWEAEARRLAARHNLVLVLKGHRTLVTDGRQACHNATGNPGMATGGAGDVLTGLITALACQGLSPYDAARLGAHVHGLAGDLAAEQLGEAALTARDLVGWLPAALRQATADA